MYTKNIMVMLMTIRLPFYKCKLFFMLISKRIIIHLLFSFCSLYNLPFICFYMNFITDPYQVFGPTSSRLASSGKVLI